MYSTVYRPVLEGEGEKGRVPMLQLYMSAPYPDSRHKGKEVLYGPAARIFTV
jgi:hypothetical protein